MGRSRGQNRRASRGKAL